MVLVTLLSVFLMDSLLFVRSMLTDCSKVFFKKKKVQGKPKNYLFPEIFQREMFQRFLGHNNLDLKSWLFVKFPFKMMFYF